jgi:hypothetical protein
LIENSPFKDDEKLLIKTARDYETYLGYASKATLITVMLIGYYKKFFDKPSPMMMREIFTAGGSIGFLLGCDYLANIWMWDQVEPLTKQYKFDKEKLKLRTLEDARKKMVA